MATLNFELNAQTRDTRGKSAARALRRLNNHLPAIVYGGSVAPISITLDHNVVTHALQNEAFFSHVLNLKIDDKSEKVVLKSIQRHPYKPVIMHIDFLRVNANEKLHMHVPVHFLNEDKAPGAKSSNGGGIITHHVMDIEVRCLPANLPEFIGVDLSKLEINQSIHLSDLKLAKGIELVALTQAEPNDLVVVSIHPPRVHEEPETPVTEITGEKSEDGEQATAADDSQK